MSSPASVIKKYCHLQRSDQLGDIITLLDKVSEISQACLDASFVVLFHREPKDHELIPVALQHGDDIVVSDMTLLEKEWSSLVQSEQMTYMQLIDLDSGKFNESIDRFAERNGFHYCMLIPHYKDQQLTALMVAYWQNRPESDPKKVWNNITALLDILDGSMALAEQLHSESDFTIRLGQALSISELQIGSLKFSELVSEIVRSAHTVAPVDGVCLLSKNPTNGIFKVSDYYDSKSHCSEFSDEIVTRVSQVLSETKNDNAKQELWFDLSTHFRPKVTSLIAQEIYPDKDHHLVLVSWTRQPEGFSQDDLVLLSIYCSLSQTFLGNALYSRRLRKSKRVLEKSSARITDAEVFAALADMTSGLAHDFNNVLGGIIGRVQLMKITHEDEDILTDLGKIEKLALDGAETIRHLQEYSTRSKYKELEPVDLCEVLKTVIDDVENKNIAWKKLAAEKRVAISPDVTVEKAVIDGFRLDLLTAFEKLIENAVEHSPHNATVTVKLSCEKELIYLSIADSGKEISEVNQKKMFYPFFTTNKMHGTGLGLATVYGIVVRHGGDIQFETNQEMGTVFTITFKCSFTEGDDSDITSKTNRSSQLRILVVDDNKQIREILSDMLTIDGHTITACADGYSALDAVEKQSFDLIITDLGMPGMSGLDMAAVIHKKLPDLPIAMITGWGTQLDQNEITMKGVKVVLPKPFHLKDVKALVRELTVS